MIALSQFTSRLYDGDVPPVNGFPSPEQYVDAVRDAVAAYNEVIGTKKAHTFTTVSGQASYAMPADFSRLIYMSELVFGSGGALVTAAGLVPSPLNGFVAETFMVQGNTLTIYPTPAYALERITWYRAIHVLDETGDESVYSHMTDSEFRAIYPKASANVWRIICGQVTRSKSWRYTHGDTVVDKTNVAEALRTWVAALDKEFMERATRLRGTHILVG